MASVSELILPDGSSEATPRRPMIVVDDAHVSYRVYASGKRMSARDSLFSLRALRGGRGLKTVPALRGVTFTASEGETIGVIGHNGSGKSTLFRAMSGLIPTSPGTIWAADRPVLLGVNAALVPELSGENNIKLGLLAMGFTPEEASEHIDEIADFAELNEFIHHPMRTYSSGMGARLRFAIASAKAHSILLIDEALSVGDRRFKIKSEERIRELRDTAGLVMIVSHSASSLRDTCERVLWIHKGELRADGAAEDVINDYVKWTKQPGSTAVGAASTPKAPQRSDASPTSQAAANRSAPAAVAQANPIAASSHSEPGAAAVKTPPAPATAVGSPTAVPAPRKNSRRVARRDRYRRTIREGTRREIIALATTASAILLAIGAGAGIALVSLLP
jgi:ABC-type polysaccharide/polyol phosphate transport system ATPase subunit